MSQCENACSWTSNYVAYYHHTINRAKVSFHSSSVLTVTWKALDVPSFFKLKKKHEIVSSVSSTCFNFASGREGDGETNGVFTY